MGNFIQLHRKAEIDGLGLELQLNTAHIVLVRKLTDGGCEVFVSHGESVIPLETYDEFSAMLTTPATRG